MDGGINLIPIRGGNLLQVVDNILHHGIEDLKPSVDCLDSGFSGNKSVSICLCVVGAVHFDFHRFRCIWVGDFIDMPKLECRLRISNEVAAFVNFLQDKFPVHLLQFIGVISVGVVGIAVTRQEYLEHVNIFIATGIHCRVPLPYRPILGSKSGADFGSILLNVLQIVFRNVQVLTLGMGEGNGQGVLAGCCVLCHFPFMAIGGLPLFRVSSLGVLCLLRITSYELSVIVLLNNAAISSSIRILDFNCGFLVLVMILSFFAKLLCASGLLFGGLLASRLFTSRLFTSRLLSGGLFSGGLLSGGLLSGGLLSGGLFTSGLLAATVSFVVFGGLVAVGQLCIGVLFIRQIVGNLLVVLVVGVLMLLLGFILLPTRQKQVDSRWGNLFIAL